MENKIAVIIPAYKDTYLLNTLISINNQTDKKFNLYICNDSSPYNIEKVLADFKKINKIHFEYIKFENNLGGSDLIQHWNRCINQIKNEEWIWLFSDDDLMEDNCIRDLNHQINLGIKEDVIHFNINIIDNQDKLIRKTNAYPDHLSSADFFKKLYSWKIEARMPEFVLRRSTFEEKKGFVNFDLAWRSDNATIIKLAHPNGIKSIDTSRINWRYSNENISGINNLSMIRRKQDSTIKFFNWMDSFLKATKQKYPFGRIYRNIIFSKFLYIRQLNNPEYVFNTPAVHFCHGWKLGEYFCLGKIILSTNFQNNIPNGIQDRKNILFVDPKNIEEIINTITNDISFQNELQQNALSYWKNSACPQKVIEHLISYSNRKL